VSLERTHAEGIMARSISRTVFQAVAGALLALGATSHAWAQSAQRVLLDFEIQALSLSSGEVTSSGAAGGDVYIAFNAASAVHSVVFAARDGVEIAHLRGVAYEGVDAASAATADFSSPDRPFAAADTVLVRTPEGTLFKLGNPSESEAGVAFDCEPL
jgi:hypothetical protein